MDKMIIKSALIVISAIMLSCSAETRFTRLVKRHPELIQRMDSVTIHDTIMVIGQKLDTIIKFAEHDTMIVKTKDSTVIVRLFKLRGNDGTDSISVSVEQRDRKIPYTKIVRYRQLIYTKDIWYHDKWFWYFISLCTVCVLFLGLRIFKMNKL